VATLNNILSPVWSLSLEGGGAVAEGVEAIKQCLIIIVRTTPGTDPLRPEFGCGLHRFIDQPANAAIPNMKKAILDAIGRWEPRVTVNRITHSLGDNGRIIFNIGYALVDGTLPDSLVVSVGTGGISTGLGRQRLVIRAYLPDNTGGQQYKISGQFDGTEILPAPPTNGFASVDELFAWVQNNWLNYGQWYITGDSLVVYLNPGFTSGNLSVDLLAARRLFAAIPISVGYTVTVSVGGVTYTNPGAIETPGAIVQYLQADEVLGQLGTWQIAYLPADFSEDFGDDFNRYTQVLQLITGSIEDIEITVTGA
jgi:phage baseplate assembly protein W